MKYLLLPILTSSILLSSLHAASDIIVQDFEEKDYGSWTATGTAFGSSPAKGKHPRQRNISGFKGKGLVNTFLGGDNSTGTLTSPAFKVERKYISFLIGGGAHKTTALQLLIGGKVVDSRSGADDEFLTGDLFDISKHLGKMVQLRIIDKHKGGWGHINVDHIVQTDTKPKAAIFTPQEKEFVVSKKYLVIPISNGKGKGKRKGKGQPRLELFADGKKIRSYTLNLASSEDTTDWYAYFTIDSYKGKKARVVMNQASEEAFALIRQSDTIPGQENFYKEPHRPQFHFTQRVGWNNDPNGMVYHKGTWHFFYQHNPVGLPWGNMTWGHATSKDLIYWEQQPNKLFPVTMAKGACFSGGATVDKLNTAGWGKDTLVAFLTDTGCGESIAYSTDNGKSFTYYKDNPVIPFKETPGKPHHKGRDPKVIWYAYDQNDTPLNDKAKALGGHWVMVVFDERKTAGRNAAFYTSINMKDWKLQSNLPGYFECTELFELPVDGDKTNTRWVVFAADAKYAIGQFDGKTFTPEHKGKHQVHHGPYYASQTFDNAPDGRKIQMGWARIKTPGPFNQMFSFPHRLTLKKTADGIRMMVNPIEEIKKLHSKTHRLSAQSLATEIDVKLPVKGDLFDIRATIEMGTAKNFVIQIGNTAIKYDGKLNGAELKPIDGKVSVQILFDRSIMEIVGNNGRVFITAPQPHQGKVDQITVTANGGDARLIKFEVHELKPIWDKEVSKLQIK